MITYVDTSTLLKLVVDEAGSDRAAVIWSSAESVAAVSLIEVEARSALAAAARAGRLTPDQHTEARTELGTLITDLYVVEVTRTVIADAAQLAEVDELRGYDAVHLAAALMIGAVVLTSADDELCDAAERHGLHVANPLVS
jgi:predicted nucleic acid-binding protein